MRNFFILSALWAMTLQLSVAPASLAGLVGHWSFDEGAGSVAGDSSGFGQNASFAAGGPGWTASGVHAAALDLPSDPQYLLAPLDPGHSFSSGFTIALWIRPSAASTQYVVRKSRHREVDGFEVSLSGSAQSFYARFNQNSLGNAYKVVTPATFPIDGVTWMHFAASFDGSEIRLYTNGVLDTVAAAPGLVIADNALPLSIGAQDDGYRSFNGGIDDLFLFDHALTASDVAALMSTGALLQDSDGDGVPDSDDPFPVDPTEWADADADGVGNNVDLDDDADGMPDAWEALYGFDPLDAADAFGDRDADGVLNLDEYLNGTNPDDFTGPEESGMWSFDEGVGLVVGDSSPAANHGAFTHSTSPSWVTGVYGAALEFDGSGARVLVPDDEAFSFEHGITVAAWIRPVEQRTQYVVKKARSNEVDGFELSLSSSSGKPYARFQQASYGNDFKVHASSSYPTDGITWMHLATTFDGEEIRVYVDGALESVLVAPGLELTTNTLPMSIGAQDDGASPFAGALDDVRVLRRALSELEIANVMAGLSSVTDTDGDGVIDAEDAFPADPGEWADLDADGLGDNADLDDDGDGMSDAWEQEFGFDPRDPADAGQDADADGFSNFDEFVAGTHPRDRDGDGVGDDLDAFPDDPADWADFDGDGLGDNADPDDDQDGVDDTFDAFPLDASESADTDADGTGNNADADDDGDGMPDAWELQYGFDPLDPADAAGDADLDGVSNLDEYLAGTEPLDTDGDGVPDGLDPFPSDPGEWLDSDADGVGNNADADDDGDGMPDVWELQYSLNPLDPADGPLDSDTDGISNAAEYLQGTNPIGGTQGPEGNPDTDGDGLPDAWETQWGLDPADPSDAALDLDADGTSNLAEFFTGGDPTTGPAAPAPGDYFVEQGSGCTSPYPTCGTEAAPFDDIDFCAAAMIPGDTCWVKDGVYTKGADLAAGRPYQPALSGTVDAPIAFRAYPGHRPLIGDAPGVTWNFGTGDERSYLVYSGFRLDGVIRIKGGSETSRSQGVVIEGFEICGGGGKDDGNWSGIFAEFVEDLTVRNNVIRDVSSPSGSGQKGITIFNGRRTLVEHNYFLANASEGVFDKEGGEDNVFRRNVFDDNQVALKINNQSDGNGVQNERTLIHENLFLCSDASFDEAIRLLVEPTDWRIFNNTSVGCDAIVVRSSSGSADGGVVYNNIWWSDATSLDMWHSMNGDDREPDFMDYNLYAPGGTFEENQCHCDPKEYFGLADWSSADHPQIYDQHSLEADPQFVDPAARNYRLQSDSPARGAGIFGEDLGAWPRDDATQVGPSVSFPIVRDGSCFD